MTPASCTGCSPKMLHAHIDPTTGLLTYLTPTQIAQFSTPGPGQFSNLGRNYFRLPGYTVVNLSVGKVTRMKWDHTLELRMEVQNAFNSLYFEQPASAHINSSFFGVADPGTVENFGLSIGSFPRTIQLAAKYAF